MGWPRLPVLAVLAVPLLVAAGCGDDGAAGDGSSGTGPGTTTGAGTGPGTGPGTGGVVGCQELTCPAGTVGCPCRGDGCDAGATCQNGSCVELDGDMAVVPEGPFCMGCVIEQDDGCVSDELPAHEVWLDAFLMDVHEVTQSQWKACVDAGVCPVPDMDQTCAGKWDPVALADHPVVCVDFNGSVAYCEWVGKRLPTEAEWEKAARGTDGRLYPWGNEPPTCDLANFEAPAGECVESTTPVGSYPMGASPYGVQDLAGSVWERTMDWYAPDYYFDAPRENPPGAVTGTARVLRGGGFTSVTKFLRATARDGARAPWKTARNVGLRCALTP